LVPIHSPEEHHWLYFQECIVANLSRDFIKFLLDYLKDRIQVVKFPGSFSQDAKVKSGVPQGSVLGPLLFNFFIRGLTHSGSHSFTIKYADDTTFLVPIFSKAINQESCLNEIKQARDWCCTMGLMLNDSKTKVLIVSKKPLKDTLSLNLNINGNDIIVKNLKWLGVTLNAHMFWESHYITLCKAFARRVHSLRVLKSTPSKKELLIVYNGLIGSLLDYAAPIFMNATIKNDDLLNSCVKRAHKIICGPNCKMNCIPDIASRRLTLSMNYFLKIINNENHILRPFLPPRSNRSTRLIIPYCSLQKFRDSFSIKCAIQYNSDV